MPTLNESGALETAALATGDAEGPVAGIDPGGMEQADPPAGMPDDALRESAPQAGSASDEGASRASIGATLRQARTALGLQIDPIAAQLKVSSRKLNALENEQWDVLPQGPYLRGLIRSYAKMLQLDSAPLLQTLETGGGNSAPPAPLTLAPTLAAPFPDRSAAVHDSRLSRLMMIGAPLFALVALGVWWSGTTSFEKTMKTFAAWSPPTGASPHPSENPPLAISADAATGASPHAEASAPLPAPPEAEVQSVLAPGVSPPSSSDGAAPAAAPVALRDAPRANPIRSVASRVVAAAGTESGAAAALVMTFHEDAWVEVREANGHTVLSQLNRAGAEKAIDGTAPLEMVIGNAPGVTVTYHGSVIDLAPYTRDRVAHVTLK